MFTVCICALAAGCVGARNADDSGVEGRQNPETASDESSAQETTMMSSGLPPGSTLSYGGESVRAGIGTFCWDSATLGMCADASGIVLGKETLTAPSGASLSLAYKGDKLSSLDVVVYEAGREARRGRVREAVFEIPYGDEGAAKDLRVWRFRKGAKIAANLSSGEYVLDVFAKMPEGDVSYGFRLAVEGRKAAS